MERKFLQNNWSEMRGQIGEWWEDLTEDDLDMIDSNQEQLITVLQERYGYSRNLAFLEVKTHMASCQPEGKVRENHSPKDIRALQFPGYDYEDWPETNNHRGFYGQ
jgi:uncharacterized protein YjbJ (UPF0337 family)